MQQVINFKLQKEKNKLKGFSTKRDVNSNRKHTHTQTKKQTNKFQC